MENDRLRGLGVAMITPFKENLEVDFDALGVITEYMISNGVNYLVVMGTTGENPTLSNKEQLKILEKVQLVNEGRVPIVFGIAGNDTHSVVDRLKGFDYTGVEAILSASPYYNKPNQTGILRHYTELADASSKPIILYNVPGRTGSMMHYETILKLAEHKNIAAVKEASGNMDHSMSLLKYRPEGFLILSGDDDLTLPYISLGMDGVISVLGNAYPKLFSQMIRYALDDNFEIARYLHYKLLPVIKALFEDGNPGGVKSLMKHMGLCSDAMRPPLFRVAKSVDEKLAGLAKLT